MNRKLIAIDLDGTLLNSDKKVSDEAKRYLKSLKEQGHIIVIATGRILRSAIDVTDGADFANYVVGSTGGVVYDLDNKKVLFMNEISKENINKVCSIYSDDIDRIELCDLDYYHIYSKNNYDNSTYKRTIYDIESYIKNSNGIIHMAVIIKKNFDEIYNILRNCSFDLKISVMRDSYSTKRWLEISSVDISKYNGVKIISMLEKIDNDDIIAFGDSLNDIDMLDKSGTSIAVSNAIEEVKNVSNYVTKSYNEEGVIEFLKWYL